MTDIKNLTKKINKFVKERDWKKFHNHKDMALSLVLEAVEVLEHFQWKASIKDINKHAKRKKTDIADELADVAIYLFELADNLDINIAEAIENKLRRNAIKYPISKAKGSAKKYTEL
jgi:dCTP diphosphatase